MELFSDKRILTVSQLTSLIRGVLEENFDHVWVEGEVSNLSLPASGHCYFTLKDSGAQLRCVMFRASARNMKFRLRDGMGMIARGRISLFEPRGEYQLIVEYLEPQGIGALQLAFAQLKERLAKEGLFEEGRKKPLPRLPRRIGVVTSATGAAIHDILNVVRRRFAAVEVLISPVRVQGEGAAEEIARAIRDFNRYRDIDVMIVGRGGGSLEDLWAFNEEVVARAISQSKIPVISAVGHEVDYTIADFVADLRAPTPSAAAELVIASRSELEGELESLSHRLERAMRQIVAERRGLVNGLARALKEPSMLVDHLAQRVDDLSERLDLAVKGGMVRRRERLAFLRNHLRLKNPAVELAHASEALEALLARGEHALHRILERWRERTAISTGKLHGLSPLLTLGRGYAIAQLLPEGRVITDSASLARGDRLRLRFQRGSAIGVVEETFNGEE
ncbi:MAG TPA: exodeoxyribonuclease VII large subunit [Geobacteraceae bacterium]